MKNPNGYGSVFKLTGNRRRPWCARITAGWSDDGKQQYKTLGYFEKRQDAMNALADFNTNPYDIDQNAITFAEIYEKWSKKKFETISTSRVKGYGTCYNICAPIHDMKFVNLRTIHLQEVIDKANKKYGTNRQIKVLFSQLYQYAMKNDIVDKDYSKFVEIGKSTKSTKRKPFAKEEIELLWKYSKNMLMLDTVLIMIYTGMRIGELLTIRSEDVNLESRTMIGGIKTEAGKDRTIPIHKKIVPLIEKRLENENEFLITTDKNKPFTYEQYLRKHWNVLMERLKLDHSSHDCRHTFITAADNCGVNPITIKRIVGHADGGDVTAGYTHKDVQQLIEAIDKIEI